jgi:hypothetical protein
MLNDCTYNVKCRGAALPGAEQSTTAGWKLIIFSTKVPDNGKGFRNTGKRFRNTGKGFRNTG